jgi:hypothetical protein
MSVIYIEANGEVAQVRHLVESAVHGEIARLELALQLAQRRLQPFEEKYGVSSDYFISEMAAEDMSEGDDEYVRWAGEYRLMERLQEKLQRLSEVEFSDSRIFPTT